MKKADLYFNVLRLPVDAAMIVVAGILTYVLRTNILDQFRPVLFQFNLPLGRYLTFVLAVGILFIIAYAIAGLYSLKVRMNIAEEISKVALASSATIMLVIVFIFLRQELFNSRFLVLGGWVITMACVTLGRLAVRLFQRYFVTRRNFGVHRLLIIGNDMVSEKIIRAISANRSAGYRIVQHLADPDLLQIQTAISNPGIDEVILANPNYRADKIIALVDFCNEHHLVFKFVPNIYQTLTTHYDVDAISNIPLVELKRTSLDGWGRIGKRIFDAVFALLALVLLSPLFLVIACAIAIDSAGPMVVRLRRVSRNHEFSLYKFRSMVANAEELKPSLASLNERDDGPLFKIRNDPRVTGVGRWLRRYRLDELPQFLNVLKGDISVVGPRPHQPDEIARYTKHHKRVLAIKAGATGLAQISGSSDLPFEEEVTLDTFYIENWSLWLDFKIIVKTAWKMVADHSAV